jgi:hypothetical protein
MLEPSVNRQLHRRFVAYALFAGLGLAAAGCFGSGSEPSRQPIAGIVLLDGRPLDTGTISFFPAGRAILGSPVVAADVIRNGRFALSRERGLARGKYRIFISSPRAGAAPKSDSETAEALDRELIPLRFNRETELEVEVKDGMKEVRIAIASR